MTTGLALGAAFALVIAAAPGPVLGLLTSHRDVVALAAEHRFLFLAAMVPGAAAFILDGFFIGLTAGRTLRNAMLISLAVFLPGAAAAYWLRSSQLIWLALAAFMVARVVTLGAAAGKIGEIGEIGARTGTSG